MTSVSRSGPVQSFWLFLGDLDCDQSQAPLILSFLIAGTVAKLNNVLTISTSHGVKEYWLKGIVYYFQNHFMAQIICCDNMVWFHDGLEPGLEYDGMLTTLPSLCARDLSRASAVIYLLSN